MDQQSPHEQGSDTMAGRKKQTRTDYSASESRQAASSVPARKVHVILNSKGGIGKSFVAGLIAQYLKDRGEPVTCFDADAQNHTLSDLRSLAAEPVAVFKSDETGEVNIRAIDAMVERFATEDTHFVVDSGSTTFVPLSSFLVMEPAVSEALAAAGKQMVVHAIISGGPELVHCGKGLEAMATQFPPEVQLIVWLNEHHGKIEQAVGSKFEETPLFQAHKNRISGVVHLAKLNPVTFGADLADMLGRGLTFAEADQSADFYLMTKQRLRQVQRPIWSQLSAVL
jgi:hypothetical protein